MEIKEAWLIKIHKNLLAEKEKIHKKDIRFFQIDLLLELARRSQIYSGKCKVCSDNKKQIEILSTTVADEINTIKGRSKISREIDKILKHLRKNHKIFIKGYLLSLYSFTGILAGSLAGIIFAKLAGTSAITGVLIGFTAGLFLGRFTGQVAEKKATQEERIIKPQIISPLEEMIKASKEQKEKN